MERKRFVAYYRVSTGKQNSEMPAQKRAVKNYLKSFWPPEASFTEVESGAKNGRPELAKALAFCKAHGATLVVAKLDRLSRDLGFIASLQDDVDFVCCDMPQATRETIGFMAVMARWEREQIGKRTKEALAEKRRAGVALGAHNPKVQAGLIRWRQKQAQKKALRAVDKTQPDNILRFKPLKASVKVKREFKRSKVQQADQAVLSVIKCLRGQGLSFEKVARSLNQESVPTRRGGKWTDMQVIRIVKRNGLG